MKTENQKWYVYEYIGEWWIYDKETGEQIRTVTERFYVECEYPPSVWDLMEEKCIGDYSSIMSESYSEVLVDFDDETEYHEGNEDYWRV